MEKRRMWAALGGFLLAVLMTVPSMGGLADDRIASGSYAVLYVTDEGALEWLGDHGVSIIAEYDSFVLGRVPSTTASILSHLGVGYEILDDYWAVSSSHSGIEFDAKGAGPTVPYQLRSADSSYTIIRFAGPVKAEWRSELEASGVEFFDYLHDFAYVAGTEGVDRGFLESRDYVSWMGPYQPAFKISTDLQGKVGYLPIEVFTFPGVSPDPVADVILARGGEVLSHSSGELGGHVKARASNAAFADVAAIDGVRYLFFDEEETPFNNRAGRLLGAHDAWYASTSGYLIEVPDVGLTGRNEIIGITDTGFDTGSATSGLPDFFQGPLGDRVLAVRFQGSGGNSADQDGHGTLVAGNALGNGFCREYYLSESTTDREYHMGFAGLAPEAELSFSAVQGFFGFQPNPPVNWPSQYGDGARLLSNSWGGGSTGSYGTNSNYADGFVTVNQDATILVAAGNEGPASTTVSSPGTAKNVITVGAIGNDRTDEQKFPSDPNKVSDFSSRGATADSRGKPDVVAPGESVGTTKSTQMSSDEPFDDIVGDVCPNVPSGDGTDDYQWFSGTSAATPLVAGASAVVRQYYRAVESVPNAAVTSQLVKATLINGAVDIGYGYPYHDFGPSSGYAWSYDQGWGRVNLKNSLFPAPPASNQWAAGTLSTPGTSWDGASQGNLTLDVVSSRVPLRVTLVWLDTAGSSLNNDLDLTLTSPSAAVYNGNQFQNDWSVPTTTLPKRDRHNNVENVYVQTPEVGTWTLTVEKSAVTGSDPSPFAVIVSADIGGTQEYSVVLTPKSSTVMNGVAGGSAVFLFNVLNFGTNADNILLEATPDNPAAFVIAFEPTSPLSLASNEDDDVMMKISILGGTAPGLYNIGLTTRSNNDITPPIAQDSVQLKIDVLSEALPKKLQVTDLTWFEGDPTILTYEDLGDHHIWIAYLSEEVGTNGKRVFVKHSTWARLTVDPTDWDKWQVSVYTEGPEDPRIYRLASQRIVVSWHGNDPSNSHSVMRVSYIDFPYMGPWTQDVLVDDNTGPWPNNGKRRSFIVEHGSRLYAVFELLGYNGFGSQASFMGTDVAFKYSTDQGSTWPSINWGYIGDGGATDTEFFPTGCRDNAGTFWIPYYLRIGTTDRDMYYRTISSGFSLGPKTLLEDTAGNEQFPGCHATTEGVGGNRVYVYWLSERYTGQEDWYRIARRYTDNGGSSWSTTNVAGIGQTVSQAGYTTGQDQLSMERTTDGYNWLFYQEQQNPYGVIQFDSAYVLNDPFNPPVPLYRITADPFGKSHPTYDSVNEYVYMTYSAYSNAGNMDIWVTRFNRSLAQGSVPDTEGPVVNDIGSDLSIVAQGGSLRLAANIDDTQRGYSNIQTAEYWWDVGPPTSMTAVDGLWNSPVEASEATVSAAGLSAGMHSLCVRGQDAATNWGGSACIQIQVTGGVGPQPTNITSTYLSGIGYADVSIQFERAPDEGQPSGTAKYEIWRAAAYAGPYSYLGEIVASSQPTYTYVAAGDGHGDPSTYYYIVRTVDAGSNFAPSPQTAGKIARAAGPGTHPISVPFIQADPSLSTVLQTVQFEWVRAFDGGSMQWTTYWTDGRASAGLTDADLTQGLWVRVTSGTYITLAGLVPSQTTVSMAPGWNFVAIPAAEPLLVQDAFLGMPVSRVEGYDSGEGPYFLRELFGTDLLVPGYACWVYADSAFDWIVSN